MTDGGGYDNSSVGYPRGEGREKKRPTAGGKGGGGGRGGREGAQGATKREGTQAERTGNGRAGGKEDVCPLAMIIAESHRTWKDRKNDSPSAVFSFAIARRERERARM